MKIAEVLSGSVGPEGVHWMLAGAPHKALRRELAALLPSPGMLGALRLRLARLKPGRRFVAFYDAHLRHQSSDTQSVRPIAVTWKLHGDGDQRRATSEFGELEAEAVRRGVAAPFRSLVADLPALGMHVQVSPLDRHFPQLVRMSDPRYVHDMLVSAAVSDGALDHASASRYSVTSIRFRLGKRHVLRYDPLDAPHRRAIFAKLHAGEEGARVCRLARQIGEWLREHGEGTALMLSPTHLDRDAAVLYPQASGAPLSEGLRLGGQNLTKLLHNTGRLLFALHQLPQTVASQLELHDFAAEVKETVQASDHVCALLPPLGAALGPLFGRAQELHNRLPLEPPTFTYGELKAEHVWASAAGLTLIDFDGCGLGDPALDVGKFLADLRFWCAVYGRYELKHAQEQFLSGYGPSAPAERLLRARLYESIELVKLTVRRARTFESGWARRTEQMFGLAQLVLNDLQHRLGLPAKQSSLSWPLGGFPKRNAARGGRLHQVPASGEQS